VGSRRGRSRRPHPDGAGPGSVPGRRPRRNPVARRSHRERRSPGPERRSPDPAPAAAGAPPAPGAGRVRSAAPDRRLLGVDSPDSPDSPTRRQFDHASVDGRGTRLPNQTAAPVWERTARVAASCPVHILSPVPFVPDSGTSVRAVTANLQGRLRFPKPDMPKRNHGLHRRVKSMITQLLQIRDASLASTELTAGSEVAPSGV
jgi:hypothetical protein